MPKLFRSLSKAQRAKLAEASKRLKVTTKKKKPDGSVSVPIPQQIIKWNTV
jgi:hypothetical protein